MTSQNLNNVEDTWNWPLLIDQNTTFHIKKRIMWPTFMPQTIFLAEFMNFYDIHNRKYILRPSLCNRKNNVYTTFYLGFLTNQICLFSPNLKKHDVGNKHKSQSNGEEVRKTKSGTSSEILGSPSLHLHYNSARLHWCLNKCSNKCINNLISRAFHNKST